MKKLLLIASATFMIASVFLSGCTQAILVRIYNRTNHVISLLERTDGTFVSIAPDESLAVPLSGVARGRAHGFLLCDGDKELFFAVLTENEDKSKGYYSQAFRMPEESLRKHAVRSPEYLFEYSDGKIFALVPTSETSPSKLKPQPEDFPIQPNQTLQHNDHGRHGGCLRTRRASRGRG